MNESERRPAAVSLGADGLFVPGASAGELAAALTLYADLLLGRRPPAEVPLPRVTRTIADLRAVAASVARDHERGKHRAVALAAAVARAQQPAPVVLVAPAQPGGSSLPATITVQQAADLLFVTPQRVRALIGSGRISARRGPRAVWEVERASVVAYRTRRRERRSGRDSGADAGGAGPDGPARAGAGEGAAAA